MRSMNLRGPDGSLDPLAALKVLAVMCHPEDRRAQLRMLPGIGYQPYSDLDSASDDSFVREVCRHAQFGGLAGQALHTLIQLRRGGHGTSINNVIKIMRASPEAWHEPPKGPRWHTWIGEPKLRVHRQTLFQAFRSYRSVAHLWPAFVLALKPESSCPFPDRNENVLMFLEVSSAFLNAAKQITLVGRKREPVLPANLIWRFGLPSHLKVQVSLGIAPLSAEALTALDLAKSG